MELIAGESAERLDDRGERGFSVLTFNTFFERPLTRDKLDVSSRRSESLHIAAYRDLHPGWVLSRNPPPHRSTMPI